MVYHCMHCNEPDCLSACPVGAYTKREDGPVIYDPDQCIGCRYCMNACPFGVPHFDYDKGLIEGAFIDKCTFCPQRIDNGQEPACVATCPTDALEVRRTGRTAQMSPTTASPRTRIATSTMSMAKLRTAAHPI